MTCMVPAATSETMTSAIARTTNNSTIVKARRLLMSLFVPDEAISTCISLLDACAQDSTREVSLIVVTRSTLSTNLWYRLRGPNDAAGGKRVVRSGRHDLERRRFVILNGRLQIRRDA